MSLLQCQDQPRKKSDSKEGRTSATKCIQVHAISRQWKAVQWSLHIITHYTSLHIYNYTSLHITRCCSKIVPRSLGHLPLSRTFRLSPLLEMLHVCKSRDTYVSFLFISKIRPMNGKMAFLMVLHLTFCRGVGPVLQAGVRPFPIVNKWDQIVSNSKMLISVCFSKV